MTSVESTILHANERAGSGSRCALTSLHRAVASSLRDNAGMLHRRGPRLIAAILSGSLFAGLPCYAAAPGAPFQQAETPSTGATQTSLVEEAQKQADGGKHDEALALYRKALASDSKLIDAHLGAGRALDFMGRYSEARRHYSQAIELATPETRAQAVSAMAVSYAFESNATEAEASTGAPVTSVTQ